MSHLYDWIVIYKSNHDAGKHDRIYILHVCLQRRVGKDIEGEGRGRGKKDRRGKAGDGGRRRGGQGMVKDGEEWKAWDGGNRKRRGRHGTGNK